MKPSEHLQAAWDLIQQPGKWTQGTFARDSTGQWVNTDNKAATCWCSKGALYKLRKTTVGFIVADNYLKGAARQITFGTKRHTELNDEASSVQELAPMWELAIKLAKESEA